CSGCSRRTPQPPTGRPLALRKRGIQLGSIRSAFSPSWIRTATQPKPFALISCPSSAGSMFSGCQTKAPAACQDIGRAGGGGGGGGAVVGGGGGVVVRGGAVVCGGGGAVVGGATRR